MTITMYYMRDNHTFCKLPSDDVEELLAVVRGEFIAGYSYGGLCANKNGKSYGKMEHAEGDFAEFAPRARRWCAAVMVPSAEDVAYDSWMMVQP